MLQKIVVSNYALIDKLEIDFMTGFTVITGETGAGKSILLGALGLVIGKRADVSVLLDPNKKCLVEVVFQLEDARLKPLFDQFDLDFDQECIFRREISPKGKSRAFVNDTPVSLQQIKKIGSQLIDIHGQHDSLLLTDQYYQLEVLDTMLKNPELMKEYRINFRRYKTLVREIEELSNTMKNFEAELDYIGFQLSEFESAALQSNEYQEIEQKLNTLSHAEEIKAGLFNANQILEDNETPLLQQINSLSQQLNRVAKFLPESKALTERIESIYIDLKDISFELTKLEDQFQFDPEEMKVYQERLNLINHLMHKHHTNDFDDLLQVQHSLKEKLDKMDFDKELLEKKKIELQELEVVLHKLADKLHQDRLEAVKPFEKDVIHDLKMLGMSHAEFRIACDHSDTLRLEGKSSVRFLFSANRGVTVAEIGKIASGGELSRLMLAIKNKLSKTGMIPTLIFDEIDTGVSGEIAAKLAKLLKQISEGIQLITITHLPQIASKANQHYHIFKEEASDRVQSSIRVLSDDERYLEVAKMLSNDNVTNAALEAAKELFVK